ncbi:MAG: hypothetical protein U1E15_06635 [Hyphomicrobiales bacterium]
MDIKSDSCSRITFCPAVIDTPQPEQDAAKQRRLGNGKQRNADIARLEGQPVQPGREGPEIAKRRDGGHGQAHPACRGIDDGMGEERIITACSSRTSAVLWAMRMSHEAPSAASAMEAAIIIMSTKSAGSSRLRQE